MKRPRFLGGGAVPQTASEPEGEFSILPVKHEPPAPPWTYPARVLTVTDGDTLVVEIDLVFSVHTVQTLRLLGVNAPERGTPEAVAAAAFVSSWVFGFSGEWPLLVTTVKTATVRDKKEKYGRYLATVTGGGESLNEALITAGHAVPYMTGTR